MQDYDGTTAAPRLGVLAESRRVWLKPLCIVFGVLALVCHLTAARATDEIQVYNAEIAEIGQWTIQQHLNYTLDGRTEPDYPGGLVPNHSLNGTPEFAYGMTDWWELGFYLPFAVSGSDAFLSDAARSALSSFRRMPRSGVSSTASISNSATRRRRFRKPVMGLRFAPLLAFATATGKSSSTPSSE